MLRTHLPTTVLSWINFKIKTWSSNLHHENTNYLSSITLSVHFSIVQQVFLWKLPVQHINVCINVSVPVTVKSHFKFHLYVDLNSIKLWLYTVKMKYMKTLQNQKYSPKKLHPPDKKNSKMMKKKIANTTL